MNTYEIAGTSIIVCTDKLGNGYIQSDLKKPDTNENCEYNAAIDGIESLILAQACAGIDVTTEQYRDAVQTSLDAIGNNL